MPVGGILFRDAAIAYSRSLRVTCWRPKKQIPWIPHFVQGLKTLHWCWFPGRPKARRCEPKALRTVVCQKCKICNYSRSLRVTCSGMHVNHLSMHWINPSCVTLNASMHWKTSSIDSFKVSHTTRMKRKRTNDYEIPTSKPKHMLLYDPRSLMTLPCMSLWKQRCTNYYWYLTRAKQLYLFSKWMSNRCIQYQSAAFEFKLPTNARPSASSLHSFIKNDIW
jgi:hypothetical protein